MKFRGGRLEAGFLFVSGGCSVVVFSELPKNAVDAKTLILELVRLDKTKHDGDGEIMRSEWQKLRFVIDDLPQSIVPISKVDTTFHSIHSL
jgi:hypothetical protein